MSFSAIALRENKPIPRIDKDWFNALRAAGVLIENYLGSFIVETEFTLANNVSVFADVDGLLFDPLLVRAFFVDYYIYRNTTGAGATELSESGTLNGSFSPVANTWKMTQNRDGDAGIELDTPTAAGQIKYKSSNMTGTPDVSKIVFKARTIGV